MRTSVRIRPSVLPYFLVNEIHKEGISIVKEKCTDIKLLSDSKPYWISVSALLFRLQNNMTLDSYEMFKVADNFDAEKDFKNYVKSLCEYISYAENEKGFTFIFPKSRLAFSFNDVYRHSEIFKDKNFHKNLAANPNYDVVQIWSDDWSDPRRQLILKSYLKVKLKTCPRISGKDCSFRELSESESETFLNENSLYGSCLSDYRFGLFYNDMLVEVMTLKKTDIPSEYEILRICIKTDYDVDGGLSTLMSNVSNALDFSDLIFYSDLELHSLKDSEYINAGFELVRQTIPSFNWATNGIRDRSLKPNSKEMHDHGFYKVYRAGRAIFKYHKVRML